MIRKKIARLGVAAALMLLLVQGAAAAQGKKEFMKGLEVIRVSLLIAQFGKPFTPGELATLNKALPTL